MGVVKLDTGTTATGYAAYYSNGTQYTMGDGTLVVEWMVNIAGPVASAGEDYEVALQVSDSVLSPVANSSCLVRLPR